MDLENKSKVAIALIRTQDMVAEFLQTNRLDVTISIMEKALDRMIDLCDMEEEITKTYCLTGELLEQIGPEETRAVLERAISDLVRFSKEQNKNEHDLFSKKQLKCVFQAPISSNKNNEKDKRERKANNGKS